TASGSFKLTIKSGVGGKRRDFLFKVLAKKELVESKANLFLADAFLGGTGRLVDLDSAADAYDFVTARGAFSLTLEWTARDDTHLTLRPTEGRYLASQKLMSILAEVLSSSEPKCPKGTNFVIRLIQNPAQAIAFPAAGEHLDSCRRVVGHGLRW